MGYCHIFKNRRADRARLLYWAYGLAVALLLGVVLSPASALAACANPTGAAGDVIWNATKNAPTYCNNTNWIAFPKGAGVFQASAIQAGDLHSCSIWNGGLYCWGDNSYGQTGLGTTTGSQTVPAQVGSATNWTGVSAGSLHSCGIAAGALYCWGTNASGKTGLGTTSGTTTTPTQVGSATNWTMVGASAYAHTCGIAGGALYCWGSHVSGRTGLGLTTSSVSTPTQVGAATNWTYIAIGGSASSSHSCGIAAGALYCWGANTNGKTGLGTASGSQTTPAQVGSATDWTMVSASDAHTCGIRAGALYCWGWNSQERTGLGLSSGNTTAPAQVGSSTTWTYVATGGEYTCGINAGALYCWGRGTYGQLGNGSSGAVLPEQIGTATDWTGLDTGSNHTCGVRAGASLYCWGNNADGRTGLNTVTGTQDTPAAVWGAGGGCINPVGLPGDIVFNNTSYVLQYCDGASWYAAGSYGNGGAGCTGPTGAMGDVVYNTTHKLLQYCEGDVWMAVGDLVPATCGGTVVGTYCWYYGGDNQSCDTVCAARGGCNATGVAYGAASNANCTAILNALGAPGSGFAYSTALGLNIGCNYSVGTGRVRDSNNTCAGSLSTTLRACACNN